MKYYPLLVLSLLFFVSCSPNDRQGSQNVFRYNESKGIPTLDPAFARNQTIIWPVNQLFNGLVQMDNQLNVLPCIAKSWDISEDGLKYTFNLRSDVHFHDHSLFTNGKGRKVVAQDFVYSLNRVIDPQIASPGFWIMNIVNRKGDWLDCEAPNDSTFIINLNQPFPAFTGLLTMQYCSVVPREIVEHFGDDFRSNPVGTGPFKIKLWVEGEKLVLLKNKNYFETDNSGIRLPYLDAVAITFVPDKQSEFMEFLTGRLDFLSGVNAVYKDEILSRNGDLQSNYEDRIQLLKSPYLNTEYLGFMLDESKYDKENNPLLDKRIRQAINYGFDRRKMMAYLRNNIGIPAEKGFVPPGMPSSTKNVKGYIYNSDKARDLLKDAGYENGIGLPEITLTTTGDYVDLCEFIQYQLSEVGIKINIDVASGGAFRGMVSNSKLEFFRGSWIADYPEAENYLSLFYSKNFSPNGPNYTHFASAEYDRLYQEVLKEQNPINDSFFIIQWIR